MNALTRRGFLRVVGVAGGGLALGIGLAGCGGEPPPWPQAENPVFRPNAFLQIREDGQIVLAIPKAEMGQGMSTGLATLVAEELEVDPLALVLRFAEPHPDYADPENRIMITGGSASVRVLWEPLRHAAACMRLMLVQAAAASWGVSVADCVAADGRIALKDGSRSEAYGGLAAAAAKLSLPAEVPLKPRAEWRRIGRHDARVDARAKIDGSAQFALDVQLPGLLTAVLLRSPRFGGSLLRFDATRAVQVPGVKQVLACAGGAAVIAEGYWAARSAAELVEVEWEPGPLAGLDSDAIAAQQARLLDAGAGRAVREEGEAPAVAPARTVQAEYRVPYLAHATMEPLNAVASVQGERCEVWAGNQAPDVLQGMVARALGIPAANVTIHSTYLGGGFGRRAMLDFAVEAALVAQVAGAPVKLVWSREDDMRHDYYRPAALSRQSAEIGADGSLLAWRHELVAPSIYAVMMDALAPAMLPAWLPGGALRPLAPLVRRVDDTLTEGAADLPYRVPYLRVGVRHHDPGVPVGVWRSVGHSQNAFFAECFADEIAHALGEDPLAFRLSRLAEDSRHARVLKAVAEAAGWGKAAAGRVQGLAVHESFGTVVAEVVELERSDGKPRIARVVCAVDCGTVINPDVVRMQVESAVVFALSAALHGRISIRDGAVEQGNFDDFPVLRIDECPPIETVLLDSEAPPSGIGEPPTPPLAPALANALFALTGERQRTLPLAFG
jgi:CO/xanthine dehydrogenase Mo-binding subunit